MLTATWWMLSHVGSVYSVNSSLNLQSMLLRRVEKFVTTYAWQQYMKVAFKIYIRHYILKYWKKVIIMKWKINFEFFQIINDILLLFFGWIKTELISIFLGVSWRYSRQSHYLAIVKNSGGLLKQVFEREQQHLPNL